MIRIMLGILAAALLAAGAAQAERDAVRTYMFGNSLVHHLSETPHLTAAPYWVGQLAEAAGKDFAVNGQWGFLRNFARDLPPTPNWSFPGVADAWPARGTSFGVQDFDAVVLTPANFIQYRNPDIPYDDEGSSGYSPLTAMLEVFDHVRDAEPDARLFLYEGWADMLPITGAYPPDAAGHARYLAVNGAEHPAWYDRLQQDLARARPDMTVTRIPVSRALAALVGPGGPLENLPPAALYTDGSPHGTPTLYLLAGAVTYAALFDAPVPAQWQPPEPINPRVRDAWPAVAATIDTLRPEPAPDPARQTAQAAEPAPDRAPAALPQPGMRPAAIPALGFGLSGVADWSTQHPFIDLMKSARPWVGHTAERWGGASTQALRAGGHLSPDGWPLRIPEGVRRLETVLLADMPEDADYLRGEYVVLYDGQAEVQMTGRASRVRYEPGRISFFYEPGPDIVGLAIDALPQTDPIRNIRVVRADMLPLLEAGGLFNPEWLRLIEDSRVLRFMDWMQTNGSLMQSWDDRPRLSDATWAEWGVPVEVMVRLANRIGADPWFTMPHMADDAYVRRFAETVRDSLDPRLKAYVEYSNEVWNFVFPQAGWAKNRAEELWGEAGDGWMQFYGLRAAQVADIWADVYGPETPDRLVRVVSTHTGWAGLEASILEAPLARLTLGKPPKDAFDAYAVTGYFGHEMGGEEMAPLIDRWLDASEEAAEAAGRAQGLSRVALREYVQDHRFDAAMAPLTDALRDGSLRELTEEIFPYHAAVARDAGLRLIMYEGGTHVAARGSQMDDRRVTDFFSAHAHTPEMAQLYEILLSGWVRAGGTLFNAFVDVARVSRWGNWGSLRHLGDSNVRWDMLMAYNATGPADWEPRDPDAFANGVTLIAPDGGGRLTGTAAEDVLAGGPGDDTLVSGGGDDRIGGGAGDDVAVLPGARAEWRFTREGDALIAEGPAGRVRLVAVERLAFEAAPDAPDLAVSGL